MFAKETYIQRRERLETQVRSGVVLLLGNEESPMNYAANTYPFRQDSTFLYFFGLDQPGLAAVLDLDEGTECLFGDDPSLDDIVWTGPRPLLRDRSQQVGVMQTACGKDLGQVLSKAVQQGRTIHTLPQYRAENMRRVADSRGSRRPSPELIRAVVEQRSIKSAQEVEQIERALGITAQMQTAAMKMAKPGVFE